MSLPTSPSTLQQPTSANDDAMDLPTLLLQMQETISQIHTTITALQPPSSSHGDPYPIASPEERTKLTDLATRRDSAIRSLLTAFSAESESLSQKRRVERAEILERRRQEDEELQRRRREEDEQWEERLRHEDEERERRLETEKGEVERETDELMGEIERGWERRWEEGRGLLRGLEGRRKELNRLIEEKLQAHTETPLPLNARAILEARKTSTVQMLVSEQTSQHQETSETSEPTETRIRERGFLPAAAFENVFPSPPDLDLDYKPEAETQQEEETLARETKVNESDLAVHLQEKMASMSMDDLLNEPNTFTSPSPAPVASRPTSPVGRTLSAVDTEEQANTDNTALEPNNPVPEEPSEVPGRQPETKTETTGHTETSTKTSPVDVDFQGLMPIRAHPMDENLHLNEFVEEKVEEKDEGEEHCGLPVEHHGAGSAETVVSERAASFGTEEFMFRGRRHDSLGIIHPLPAPAPTASDGGDGDGDGDGDGTAAAAEVEEETAVLPRPAAAAASDQEASEETSDYTPYYSKPTTPVSQPVTPANANHVTDAAHNTNPPASPTNAEEANTEADLNPNPNPNPEEAYNQGAALPDPADDIDTATVPSDADVDVDAHSNDSISTASERGSYSDINETASLTSPTAAKAEEEDDDADFVAEQWQQDGAREVQQTREEEVLRGLNMNGVGSLVDAIEAVEVVDAVEAVEAVDEMGHADAVAQGKEEGHGELGGQKGGREEHEHEHNKQGHEEEEQQAAEDVLDAEAPVEKEVLEKQEVLQGFLVDDPAGPAAHSGRFELEKEEEVMRARGVLEPPCASGVDLGGEEGEEGNEEAESPVLGVEGVAEEPPVTREESPPGPEHGPEPEPVPVEELVREQEEMGLGRPESLDEHNQQILDMDHHPLDHSHVSHLDVVGVALTHSEKVHLSHTPLEEGEEPAHYFVNEHHVPHSTDDFYTPAEVPLGCYDHHQEQLDESYVPRDHAEEQADEEAYYEREVPVPDVSEEVEEDTQPRYQLYERPYTPSDFAPTPGLESNFPHVEHAGVHDEMPEVVVTPQPADEETTADDQRADMPEDEQDTEDDDDDETGHQLERVPSRQDVEEHESPGPSVDDFPMPGETVATAEHTSTHTVQFGDVHHRDMEPGPEHYIDREEEGEDAQVQEALSSESESEDFEGRDEIVLHHLDAIAEEEDEAAEAELGDGVERRDMAAEAETQEEVHVEHEVEAALSGEDDVRSIPVDESNATRYNDAVQSGAEAEAEAEAENIISHPQDVVESAPAGTHVYDTTAHTQQTDRTEATKDDSDVDSSTEPSEPERIHEEEGPDPRFSEEQPAVDEAHDVNTGNSATEEGHALHDHQAEEDHTDSQPGPDDDEYDPFRYSPPKKTTEGQATPTTSPTTSLYPVISSSVKDTTSDSSATNRDNEHVVNEANPESQEQEQTVEHVEDDARVDDQPDVERSSDKVLSVEEEMMSASSREQTAKSERSLAEELEDVGEEGRDEGHNQHSHYEEEGAQQQEHHDQQSPVGQVEVDDREHDGRGYRSSDQEEETLADEEANRAYDHDGHSHNHDEVEAQPPQPCEPPVLQLIEPSDTENGEFASETSPVSGRHPHAVTRDEDTGMGRDWSEVDQFLSESDSSEDEVDEPEHVEEAGAAAADTVAHTAHPTVDVEIDAEVEAALETPATEASGRAEDTAEQLHKYYDEHGGMHHSPEVATYDDGHGQDNRISTPGDEQHQFQHDDDNNAINPAPHHHDLPPLTIPATPPSPTHDSHYHGAHGAHDAQSPEEEEQEFTPRDVTNRPWRSNTVNTVATFATADTSNNTVPTASSPQSAHSGTTLSSGPSSPVGEDSASGQQDPRIRDSIGRPRGVSSLTDGGSGTDYSGGGYGGAYADGAKDKGESVPKGPKVMEMWHQREASVSRNEEVVRLSGDTRERSHNRGASGSGSGSGGGGGSSLFQRMRSVFEQSATGGAPAASASASASNNRVSMPSFFTKQQHSSSPSQQRPMSTSPYSSSRHRNQDGYAAQPEPTATEQVPEADEAEQAGENSALLHHQHHQHEDESSSDDGYDSEYEREKERERERRRDRRRYERGRGEWMERHGMSVHAYGEDGSSSVSRYDYGEYRPE